MKNALEHCCCGQAKLAYDGFRELEKETEGSSRMRRGSF
jgi:hypothetical protein